MGPTAMTWQCNADNTLSQADGYQVMDRPCLQLFP